jgi:hypothetical protein
MPKSVLGNPLYYGQLLEMVSVLTAALFWGMDCTTGIFLFGQMKCDGIVI